MLEEIVAELQPLIGGRIQRIDVVDVGEIVLEIRVPGRTLYLLLSTRPGLARVHLLSTRAPKRIEPNALQASLRRRLEGRPLASLSISGRVLVLEVPGSRLEARMDGGQPAFALSDSVEDAPRAEVPESRPIPADFPLSEALHDRLRVRSEEDRLARLRRSRLAPVEARIKKLARLLAHLRGDLKKLEGHQQAGELGELLKTVLGRVKRGAREVEVIDFTTGEPRTIALDPALDPRANLERYFQRAKRLARGRPRVEARITETQAQLERAQEQRKSLLAATLEQLEARVEQANADVAPDGKAAIRAAPTGRKPGQLDRWARRFETIDRREVWVGKGAAENDRLTFGGSRGHDLWLHARGVPGAHVLLRLAKDESPPNEALLDAAHLAVHYSGAKGEAKAEVVYTEARWVKKTKGAAPGAVTLAKERTLLLRVDETRLHRLLGRP